MIWYNSGIFIAQSGIIIAVFGGNIALFRMHRGLISDSSGSSYCTACQPGSVSSSMGTCILNPKTK